MKMCKVYDIRITEGEFAGYFNMTGIESRETAEEIRGTYFRDSEIVEREVEAVDYYDSSRRLTKRSVTKGG